MIGSLILCLGERSFGGRTPISDGEQSSSIDQSSGLQVAAR